uniref:Reverse transcriptase (RNA-dependent DNA polymerase) n=1 Tax=Gibberella zeae TaxID=5518 RepID=A0A3T1FYQ1_GIBZA|nr:hypothetical protein NDA36_mgp37 [Fusarium vorosii]QID45199.1 Reverse transcriptase (RNA-dependent DNA polymerase) [Fusarium graminearum]UPX02618.1 hypothetical protein [Fusarium vorosii]DAC73639.1 TPA_asm: hypothetical protein [Fusarium graminearum]
MRCGNSVLSSVNHTSVPLTADRSSGLGKEESSLLNLASQPEADICEKPIITKITARPFSYDKIHTDQTIVPTVLKLRESLVGYRWINLLENCSAWFSIKGEITDCSTRTSKVTEIVSKGDSRIFTLNTGLPKGSNTYGNRALVVPSTLSYEPGNAGWKGRGAATLLFRRNYVSGGDTSAKLNVVGKLNKLAERSISSPDSIIDRNLYNLLTNKDMLIYAYENIKSKPGNMTPGVSPDTLDGISIERVEALANSLRNESFQFSPSRRVLIPKASGGTRPLSIASPMDKVVQEAMRLILEAIYEPLFQDCSHGFRPNRSCHTALKEVSQKFQPAQWVIEGDLAKFFDTISHQKLMLIIESKITDRKFTKLIWKALKAGYMSFGHHKNNIIGTPQGSIISPILANIFLDQLDTYVLSLKKEFDLGSKAPRSKASRYYEYHILKARKEGNNQLMRKLMAERSSSPSIDFSSPGFKRLSYVRYADDWIIGIRGTKLEAQSILDKVRSFCTTIELNLSDSKTKLTSINRDKVLFLGTNVVRAEHASFSRMGTYRRLRRNKLGLRLEAPLDRIKRKLTSASFIVNGKSAPKFLWLHMEHDQIILLYNAVMRGYLNYYKFAHNYGRLTSYVEYILKQSCAKLLATKLSLGTMAKTYKKFGAQLTGPKGKGLFKPSYKTTLKFLINSSPVIGAMFQNKSTATLDKLECKICGSSHKVEMHHIRAMKDLNPKLSYLDREMVRVNRKRIPLCRVCHMMKHSKRKETTFEKKP